MARPRAADDFAAIRARMEELRRERSPAPPSEDPRRVGRLPGILDDDGRPAGSDRGAKESKGIGRGAGQGDRRGRAGAGVDRLTPNGWTVPLGARAGANGFGR
jgi:hypothetical protein